MPKFIRHQAFDVFRKGACGCLREIDTVFYSEAPKTTVEEVRKSLIDHDGYPSDIIVKKVKTI